MNSNPPTATEGLETPRRSLASPAIISLVLSLASFGLAGWAWSHVPAGARIPTHWNFAGKADAFGDRSSLFLLPAVMLALNLLFLVIPRLDPRKGHLLRSSRAYAAIWLALAGLLTALNITVTRAALGYPTAMEKWLLPSVGLMLVVIGNYLGKIRSNFFVGIRTPWTLSSERSWNKTHRLGGWVFVGVGLLLMAAGVIQPPTRIVARGFLVVLLLMTLWLTVYSYLVWRSDPDRAVKRT